MSPTSAEKRKLAPLATPTDLKSNAIQDISAVLAALLADVFAPVSYTHLTLPTNREV